MVDDLPRKHDGSLNKSAIIRAAHATLLERGEIQADASLPARIKTIRKYLRETGFGHLEQGLNSPYMMYVGALKPSPRTPMPIQVPDPAKRITSIEKKIVQLVDERDRILAAAQEKEVAAAREAIRTLIDRGWRHGDIVSLVDGVFDQSMGKV